jgi:anti-sigma factor RsiW
MNHKGAINLARSTNQHINNHELNALVPSRLEAGCDLEADPSPDSIEAGRHVASCIECRSKVQKYSLLVNRLPMGPGKSAPVAVNCPQHIEWNHVASGLWPQWKAKQAMMHAALCEHCGPLLRSAVQKACVASPQEEDLEAEMKTPSWPGRNQLKSWRQPLWKSIERWASVAVALVIVGVLSTRPPSSRTSISGAQFAELAVRTHRQHLRGELVLDIRTESQQVVNDWLRKRSTFSLVLPASPAANEEERSYRPEGARLVRVGGQSADFIVYHMKVPENTMTRSQPSIASLMVIPASAVEASGGIEARFTKVRFHYATVGGLKVVTWSVHGLTYALVSDEGNSTQRSCMVCHSAMRDRDLSHTPTPLRLDSNVIEPNLE